MIKLGAEITFSGEGYATTPRLLKLIQRNDDVAIYSRSDKDRAPDKPYCYEVFKVGKLLAGHVWQNGNVVAEDKETYPGNSAWGKTAWTFPGIRAAKDKFKELTNKMEDKKNNIVPVKENIVHKIPSVATEEFTIKDYAASQGLDYNEARLWVMANCDVVGKRSTGSRGKPSVLYAKR